MTKRSLYWRIHKHFFGENFYSDGYLFLNPDVAQAGVDPYKHYVKMGQKEGRTAGWPTPEQFNAQRYLDLNSDVKEKGVDPWMHYVRHGYSEKRTGAVGCHNDTKVKNSVNISSERIDVNFINFNENLYRACNPDLKSNWKNHYIKYGYKEGRIGANISSVSSMSKSIDNFDKSKKICVVVAHDLSQTGCPINTWNMMSVLKNKYNVISIALADGPLNENFKNESDLFILLNQRIRFNDKALSAVLDELLSGIDIEFAIVNSIVSRCVLPFFAKHRIPALHFIHEFAYYLTKEELEYSFLNAAQVVFSTRIVMNAALNTLGITCELPCFPQGKSEIPWKKMEADPDEELLFKTLQARKQTEGEFIFLGVGSVEYRKGVDIFIRTAAEIKRMCPGKKLRFLWAGGGYDPDKNFNSKMLRFQILQYGLENELEFLGPIKDIDSIYRLADVFLMSSVLDPLPGVVIEAMSHGLPVICFEGCSGFPDLYVEKGISEHVVAKFLDHHDMAEKASRFVNDGEMYKKISLICKNIEQESFVMQNYIDRIIKMIPDVKEKLDKKYEEYLSASVGNLDFSDYLQCLRLAEFDLKTHNRSALEVRRFEHLSPVIFGLKKSIPAPESLSTEKLNELVGGNTGNLAFHHAIDKVLGGGLPVLPWNSETMPEVGSVGVIPLANQLGKHCDMTPMYEWLKKTTMPMVGIGLGAQARRNDNESEFKFPEIKDGTKRWLLELAEHAPSNAPNISLRGEFTRRVVESLGVVDKAVVLGCPTLYINADPALGQRIASRIREPRRVALAAGMHGWPDIDKLENSLADIVTETDGAVVVAHDIEMMKLARGEFSTIRPNDFQRMRKHFCQNLSDDDFKEWARKRGKVFFDVPTWMDFYWQFDFVIGPRIHGIMLALQAGVPALCIAIDSRTQELCETMKVPYVLASSIRSGISRSDLLHLFKFDPDEFDANRRMLAGRFAEFLKNNKLVADPMLDGLAGIHRK